MGLLTEQMTVRRQAVSAGAIAVTQKVSTPLVACHDVEGKSGENSEHTLVTAPSA